MNHLYSLMDKKAYLASLKQKMGSPFLIFDERVTGVIIGPFFSVAYHAPFEWNRRITSECSRAMGFVRTAHEETEIVFLRSKGNLCLSWFFGYIALFVLIFLAVASQREENLLGFALGAGAVFSIFACLLTAAADSMTEQGAAGEWEIDKLLQDPENYFA